MCDSFNWPRIAQKNDCVDESRLPQRREAYLADQLEQLRSVATVLADHGWPVLRGTYREAGRWRGAPDPSGLRPVDEHWRTAWTVDVNLVAQWWSSQPYSVLVACGHGVDCLEVPGRHAHRILPALAAANLIAPTMITSSGRLALFVQTDRRASQLVFVGLRSSGAWAAVPPTGRHSMAFGYQWVPGMSPDRLGWRLPESLAVHDVIVANVSDYPRGGGGGL